MKIGGVTLSFLDDLSPEYLVVLTNIIAISLSKNKSADETNVLGNFIVGIGNLLLTLSSQQQYIALQNVTNKSKTEDIIIDW